MTNPKDPRPMTAETYVDCYVCGRPMDGLSEADCHCFHRKEVSRPMDAVAPASATEAMIWEDGTLLEPLTEEEVFRFMQSNVGPRNGPTAIILARYWKTHPARAVLSAPKGAPVEATPLTEEQIIDATEHIDTSRNGYFVHIARAIEHAHGIRAALAAEKEQNNG